MVQASVTQWMPNTGGTVALSLDLPDSPRGITRFEFLLSALLDTRCYNRYGNCATAVAVSVDASNRRQGDQDHIGLISSTSYRCSPLPDPEPCRSRSSPTSIRAELRALNQIREVPVARAAGRMSPRAALTPGLDHATGGARPTRCSPDWRRPSTG